MASVALRKDEKMHLRKRGNLWRIDVRYKGSRISKSFTKKGLATNWANKTLAQLEAGTYQDTDKLYSIRLKDLLQLYYDHVKEGSRRLKNFTYEIDVLRKGVLARTPLAQLTSVKLANYKNELLKTLSPSTVRKKLLLISRAISVGQKELGIPINSNPVKMVSLPKEPDHRDRIISFEEYKRLLKECNKSSIYYLRHVAELAYETLCRRGEILALHKDHLDLRKGTAIIMITKSGKKRRIGLSVRAIEVIRQLPRSIDGQLFPIDTVSFFEKEFRRAVVRAKIKNFTFHDLRHFGATSLAKAGWSTVELMAQGGWSSADMVKRYANINAEHLSKRLRS